jgi:DNA-binding CsgD family transcriptional regulator
MSVAVVRAKGQHVTAREVEVLKLIALGRIYEGIARVLGVSTKTVA